MNRFIALALAAGGERRCSAVLPVEADPRDHPVRRRRLFRHRRPRDRLEVPGAARPAGGGREPSRRERRHRRRVRRQGRSRRPHRPGRLDRRVLDQRGAVQGPALPPGARLRADHARRHHAERADHQADARRRLAEGAGRLHEEEPGQAVVLLERHRLLRPPHRRAAEAGHRHRRGARPVQGRRRVPDRHHGQPGRLLVPEPRRGDQLHQGQPHEGARGDREGAPSAAARRAVGRRGGFAAIWW